MTETWALCRRTVHKVRNHFILRSARTDKQHQASWSPRWVNPHRKALEECHLHLLPRPRRKAQLQTWSHRQSRSRQLPQARSRRLRQARSRPRHQARPQHRCQLSTGTTLHGCTLWYPTCKSYRKTTDGRSWYCVGLGSSRRSP